MALLLLSDLDAFHYYLNFIYLFFGCTGSSLLRGLSLVAVSGDYSLVVVCRLFLLWSTGLRHVGFSGHGIGFGSYGLQAVEHRPWEPSL